MAPSPDASAWPSATGAVAGSGPGPARPQHDRTIVEADVEATFPAVRALLSQAAAALEAAGVAPEAAQEIELVLAELLNNIVEHAYRGIAAGRVALTLRLGSGTIGAEIRDQGRPMPAAALAPAALPDCAGAAADLPEGGFSSEAFGVSADGRVAVGRSNAAEGSQAVLWTELGP